MTIVWTKDLTGPDGAAEAFRKDSSIDACCVITPDLFGLTGGFDSVGSGAEGTVSRGACGQQYPADEPQYRRRLSPSAKIGLTRTTKPSRSLSRAT